MTGDIEDENGEIIAVIYGRTDIETLQIWYESI